MADSIFIINHRFSADPLLSLIKAMKDGTSSRLEPRLMKLLCMLAENAGKLVSRETLVNKIRNDYGGAEEGLNQAIFFLRKTLHDSKKNN